MSTVTGTSQGTPISGSEIVSQSAGPSKLGWKRLLFMRLLLLLTIVTAWEGIVFFGFIDPFWVSAPSRVLSRFFALVPTGRFYRDIYTTIYEMLLGLGGGVLFGVLSGFALARWRTFYRVVDPFLMVIYSLPRIALAPLFILWLGIGLASKVLLAMIVAYFIMLVNTHAAIRSVDQELINAVRTTGASESFITRKVRLPSAVPWLFSGTRLAAGQALPAAVVAEMLGSTKGVGYQIARAAGVFDTTGLFTYLLVLAVLAMGLNEGLKAAESRLLAWREN